MGTVDLLDGPGPPALGTACHPAGDFQLFAGTVEADLSGNTTGGHDVCLSLRATRATVHGVPALPASVGDCGEGGGWSLTAGEAVGADNAFAVGPSHDAVAVGLDPGADGLFLDINTKSVLGLSVSAAATFTPRTFRAATRDL